MAKERIPSVYPSSESETDSGVPSRPPRTRPIPSITDLGKRVIFTSGNDKKEKYGTLRYLGRPEFSKGSWCGIELDDARGKNNGSVRGIRYFSCPQDCGIFVPVNKVEMDPSGEARARTKSTATGLSLVEKRARKNGGKWAADKKNSSPFFYNTMPRSMSIPALNQGFIAHESRPSPEHRPLRTSRTRAPLSPVDTTAKRFPHMSSLKKYTSEMNISTHPSRLRSPRTTPHPVDISTPTMPISSSGRRQMGSFSEVPLLAGGFPSNGLRSSTSCHNLLSASIGTRKLSSSKPQFKRILSPRTSPLSGHTHHQLDSEDGISCYSSTSDLSHEDISSDSDLTPRSSSNSPCFIDVQSTDLSFLLKPPSPPSAKSSTSQSPTHNRVGLPTGLATHTSTIIESSRGVGNGDWCRLPSPEHQKNSKVYQSTRNGKYTLDHPLVNGHVAANERDNGNNKENEMGGTTENRVNGDMGGVNDNKGDIFICPSSGQEMTMSRPATTTMSQTDVKRLQDDISNCLKNQVAMEARIGRMEESLLQFQSVFMRTMETMQETLKQQMEFNQLQRTAANGSRHQYSSRCDQGLGHLVCNDNTGDATS